MIADLVNDNLKIRLITRNVMAVYSVESEYTDAFIRTLKHSYYTIENKKVESTSFISFTVRNYNIYKNIFSYVKEIQDVDLIKFSEYLNFLDLNHLLWLHFYQLNDTQTRIVELLLQLASNRKVIITDYVDSLQEYSNKIYTLLFYVGLEDKLIIVPFTNISEAVNNSTCQCYVKSPTVAKIQSTFSSEFINSEFNSNIEYYNRSRPKVYRRNTNYLIPKSYKYSLFEIILIFLYSIKMLYITIYNWRTNVD
jgi:hypothetical protein